MSFESFSDLCRKVDRVLQILESNPVRAAPVYAAPTYSWPEPNVRSTILSAQGGSDPWSCSVEDRVHPELRSQLTNLESSLNQLNQRVSAQPPMPVQLENKLNECCSGIQNLMQTTGQLVAQGNESIGMAYNTNKAIETANQVLQQNSGMFQNLAQENAALRSALQQLLSQIRQ